LEKKKIIESENLFWPDGFRNVLNYFLQVGKYILLIFMKVASTDGALLEWSNSAKVYS
jgi:hypothetical protein